MSVNDLDTSPITALCTEEEWEIQGAEMLEELRAERAREAEAAAEKLAKLQVDRDAILALPDAALLAVMQEQYEQWDTATDDISDWGWHLRFTGPDDPGLEWWQLRAEQKYEQLRFIRDEAARRGIWSESPPAPVPEDTSALYGTRISRVVDR